MSRWINALRNIGRGPIVPEMAGDGATIPLSEPLRHRRGRWASPQGVGEPAEPGEAYTRRRMSRGRGNAGRRTS